MISAREFISWLLYALVENFGYIWGKCGVLWTAKLQQNLEAKYKADPDGMKNYKQAALYGARWIGHIVCDCANLLRWAAKKCGSSAIHSGSNLIFECDLKTSGKIVNGKKADGSAILPGTFVFTGENKGEHGHVGAYIGGGKVIEDEGTKTGVKLSDITAGKWKMWGEAKIVLLDVAEGETVLPAEMPENGPNQPAEPADGSTASPTLETLRRGAKGDSVRYLQTLLSERGYDLGKYGVDGDFGSATEKAVKAFQKAAGLQQDGVCGPKTWAALQAENPVYYTVTITHLPAATADEVVNKYGGTMVAE